MGGLATEACKSPRTTAHTRQSATQYGLPAHIIARACVENDGTAGTIHLYPQKQAAYYSFSFLALVSSSIL